MRWGLSGHAPMAGLFESLTVFSFCCAVAGLILCGSEETAAAWRPLSILVLLPQAGAALDRQADDPPVPCARHAVVRLPRGPFLPRVRLLRRGARAGDRLPAGRRRCRLPGGGRSALYGFSAFSAGMVCGGIWAYYAWGSYWIWTPKEIWSVDRLDLLRIAYASQVHPEQKGWPGWTKRLEMGATAAGYGVVLLTFLGVSLLLRSSTPSDGALAVPHLSQDVRVGGCRLLPRGAVGSVVMGRYPGCSPTWTRRSSRGGSPARIRRPRADALALRSPHGHRASRRERGVLHVRAPGADPPGDGHAAPPPPARDAPRLPRRRPFPHGERNLRRPDPGHHDPARGGRPGGRHGVGDAAGPVRRGDGARGVSRDFSATVTLFRDRTPVAHGVVRTNEPLFHEGYGIYVKNFGDHAVGRHLRRLRREPRPGATAILAASLLFTAANLLYLVPPGGPMRKPLPLRTGDVIAVVAPAGPVDAGASNGDRPPVGGGIRSRDRRRRARGGRVPCRWRRAPGAPVRMGVDPPRGPRGDGGARRLRHDAHPPLVDWRKAARRRKLIVGFSDLTAVLSYLSTRLGYPAFTARWPRPISPCGSTRGARRLRTPRGGGGLPREPWGEPTERIRGGAAEGVLAGGCLSVLTALLGPRTNPISAARCSFSRTWGSRLPGRPDADPVDPVRAAFEDRRDPRREDGAGAGRVGGRNPAPLPRCRETARVPVRYGFPPATTGRTSLCRSGACAHRREGPPFPADSPVETA